MVWILLAGVLAVALILAERLIVAPEDQVSAEDLLALPNSRIRLVARVERYIIRFVDPPVRGATVEFFEGDRRLGSAVTDANGYASIEIDVGGPGRRRYRIVTARAEQALVVDVLPPDAPILVLDIDHTITDIGTTRFAFTPNKNTRALPDAIDVIPRLATRYFVVFLTARDRSFLGKTRGWFHLNGLPDGPVLIRRKRFWSQKAFDHKMERLAELTRTHKCVAGVGDLPSDARAYLAHKMAAYVMDPDGRAPDIDGAVKVRSWRELEGLLAVKAVPSTT